MDRPSGLGYTWIMQEHTVDIQGLLSAWGLSLAETQPITSGHINSTLLVQTSHGERFVLQRLSPIFGAEVNLDLDAVTARLERAGLFTPRLVPTAGGDLWLEDEAGAVWRLLTHIKGLTLLIADSAGRCRAAGEFLGRFHRALWDWDYTFQHQRRGVHDTDRHLDKLRGLLTVHRAHRLYDDIAPVAGEILQAAAGMSDLSALPGRNVHGDPKISNFIFAPDGAARCLVDLDTLAPMPLAVEMGDALRSWCNPRGEDQGGPINTEYFIAGLQGYLEIMGELPQPEELEAITGAVEVIGVELAARFCADAFEESYFGWDNARYASAAEHNLQRAKAQLSLARSVREHLPQLQSELIKKA